MLISVVTINFNNASGLKETIKSVISQSFNDFEYIVVDGGSTDGSKQIIEQYADKISYWVSEKDDGIYNAMNKGAKAANGDYIAFLNSGDVYANNEVLKNVAAQNLIGDVCVGDLEFSTGGILRAPKAEEVTMSFFMNGSLSHPSSFTRRELLMKHPFNEKFRISADMEFFMYTLVKLNASYQQLKGIVSIFDTTGISSSHRVFEEDERLLQKTQDEILPPRVRADYDIFMGKNDDYHRLFYIISSSPNFKWIYRLVVILLKIVKRNKGFIRNFSI